jgi:hypothetical protein
MERIKENRLIHEKSPYLLQHAYNPVDWYPWGDEAFEKAKRENKPVFVSIGYSTCHWCHVMERESFEDEEIAEQLNKHYIAIKVDREERPDIDQVYMSVCQALTGHGGWPLSVFLTPDKLPFYAGTYFPKTSRYGSIGFIQLLENIQDAWQNKRDKLVESGKQIRDAIQEHNIYATEEKEVNEEILHQAFKRLEKRFDNQYGGFSKSPKFPTPESLMYLTYYHHFYQNDQAKEMVEKTLNAMYKGGIFDHLGGGFSRYSTDEKWLVPHFEKMLYDNAMLIYAYTKHYTVNQEDVYKNVVKQTMAYILRDMQDPKGGFYCAEDADSEGEEGLFYIWEYNEIIEILGEEDALYFIKNYKFTKEGNFERKNILNLIDQEMERVIEISKDERLLHLKQKLFEYREKRIHPHKDDKILTAWNGLMIAAMAYAGRVFDNDQYKISAQKAADFILENLTTEAGEVYVRYRDGEVLKESFVDDYAFLAWGLIELYETTLDSKYLRNATKIFKRMKEDYFDEESSSFFMTKNKDELGLRPKEIYDGAMPSGNSVGLHVMLKLARITGDYTLEDRVYDFFRKHLDVLMASPDNYTFALINLLFMLNPVKDIVIAFPKEDGQRTSYVFKLAKKVVPYLTLLTTTPSDTLEDINHTLDEKSAINEKVTFYLCQRGQCFEPLTDLELVSERIESKK